MANNFLTAINSPVDPTVPASIGPKLGATLNKGSSNITKAPVSTVTPGMKLLNNAGTYQGKPITAGTDAEVASQMKAIDASTTTQSNSKIIDKVIPENNAKLDTLAEKGITTDQQGNQKFADGTFVGEQPKVTADTADEDTQTQALLDQMKATTDAQTAAQIANIQQQYALRKQQQERLNTQQQARTQNALLMGGVTGQGSSAQYAPISSGGIVSAQENYGIQQLAQLDADENNAISAVKQAQADGDYKLMDEKLSELKDARKAKIDAASKLNDQISANNQKIAEQNQSAEKDNAIADVYAQGITDVPSIMAELRKQGISVTSTDVANSIKSFTPIGLDDLVKTLKQNGAPQEVISKVLASKNMTEAYNNAGDYANGGTGIIGEYNFYKAQAKAAGQMPVDFQTYQDIDANRKKSVTNITNTGGVNGFSGLDQISQQGKDWAKTVLAGNATMQQVPTQYRDEVNYVLNNSGEESYSPLAASRFSTAANRIVSNFLKLPQYELTANGLPYLQRIDAAMKTPGSVSDQDLLDSLTKLNTAGNAITDAQVRIITDGKSFSDMVSSFSNKFKNGGVLSDNQRQQIQTIAKTIYENYSKGYQPVYDQATKQLKDAGIPEAFWTIPNLNNLNGQSGTDTGDTIVQEEKQAEDTIKTFVQNNPNKSSEIKDKSDKMEKSLGRPITSAEFLQAFPEYK